MRSLVLEMVLVGLDIDLRPKASITGGNTWKFYSPTWNNVELRALQRAGVDIHAATAKAIFGDETQRRMAKTVNFRELYK